MPDAVAGAAQSGVGLVVEDVHWADSATVSKAEPRPRRGLPVQREMRITSIEVHRQRPKGGRRVR